MTPRRLHRIAAFAALSFVVAPLAAAVSTASAGRGRGHDADAGDGSEPADRRAARGAGTTATAASTPLIPSFDGHPAGDVAALAQVFIDDGKKEGVRGDIAFVQSQLETGWMGFSGSQIPPDAYNYAGIYAFDGRTSLPNCAHGDSTPSRCMGTPQHGVLVQIQLLAQLRRPVGEDRAGSVHLRAVRPRRAWRRCGSTSAGTTARAAS